MDSNLSGILEASYKPQREAEQDLSKLGYSYDPELSSMDTKVFIDKEGNPNIAYRGSVRAKEDWLSNANILLGGKSAKDKEAVETAKKVQAKYGKAPTSYGHSRGGRSAELAGEATGGKVYTYNKAALPQDVLKKTRKEQTDIRTSKDLVSLPSVFQSGGEKITIQSGATDSYLKAHSLGELEKKGSNPSSNIRTPSLDGFLELKPKAPTLSSKLQSVVGAIPLAVGRGVGGGVAPFKTLNTGFLKFH